MSADIWLCIVPTPDVSKKPQEETDNLFESGIKCNQFSNNDEASYTEIFIDGKWICESLISIERRLQLAESDNWPEERVIKVDSEAYKLFEKLESKSVSIFIGEHLISEEVPNDQITVMYDFFHSYTLTLITEEIINQVKARCQNLSAPQTDANMGCIKGIIEFIERHKSQKAYLQAI